MAEEKEIKKEGKKNNHLIMGGIVAVLIICIGTLIFMLVKKNNVPAVSENTGIGMESHLVLGPSDKTLDEQLAEAQKKVDEGQIGIKMNTNVTMQKGCTEGEVLIENPARNTKSFVVNICLADTGEEVYRSGMIPPNSYIEKADFTKELEPGVHNATAYFTTYTPEGVKDGQAGVNITISVLN